MRSRVLIVDDDPDARQILENILSSEGYACELVSDAPAAIRSVDARNFDLVLSDVVMDGMSGFELLDRVKESHPALPVVLVTAAGAVGQAVDAIKRGAFQYLVKPFDSNGLRRIVHDALEARGRPPDAARPSLPASRVDRFDLIGSAPSMRDLRTTIDFVARSSAPVLVAGETGVGKELVARAIHTRSARRDHPFVAVNTAAIPHELLEAELFGHVRGGFTGAAKGRKGLLTEADGGTLLLDEIGDMSFDLQAKLLRVLQFGDVRPVGSDQVHHVDVRVMASTHRDLPLLVAEGRFREDLYFRLAVIPIFVPPLRERIEDIPLLVRHYIDVFNRENNVRPKRISPAAVEALQRYRWKGNIRELRNTVERMIIMSTGDTIDLADLPETVRFPTTVARTSGPPGDGGGKAGTLREFKDGAERAYLVAKLRENGWNISKTAEVIDTPRSNLYKKLEQYQISQESDG